MELVEIPNLPGYCATLAGDIWTDYRYTGRGSNRKMYRSSRWKPIKTVPDKSTGYKTLQAWYNGTKKKFFVHILVSTVFNGPCPEGMECRHLNGIRSDCTATNLIWGTRSVNQMDRVDHGTSNRSEQHPLTKLTNDEVRKIKALLRIGTKISVIVKEFNTTKAIVNGIKYGSTWKWIS